MNKEQVVNGIKSEYELGLLTYDEDAYNRGLDVALHYVNQLDEPEKPVLNEKEAEWVDNLTNFFSLSDALYYINRCGYGYLLSFEMNNHTYELPVDDVMSYGEMCVLKERLTNAVLYDYEVVKEKRYIVEVPNPYDNDQRDFALYRNRDGEVILNVMVEKGWRDLDEVKLTEKEIKKNFAYLWEEDLAKEVEE